MNHVLYDDIMMLHKQIIEATGGSDGLRDRGALESALAQPAMTFGGEALYSTPVDKAAALGFSLIMNHPFVDGNKRIGHAAMELFLRLNGYGIMTTVDDAERTILAVAAGELKREDLTRWLNVVVKPRA